MKANRKRRQPKDRLATAIFFAIAGIPFCAMVTFAIFFVVGAIPQDTNRQSMTGRRFLANDWFERTDWYSALFLFVVVYIVSQILVNWNLIRDPPESWLRSKKDDGALSISAKEDDSSDENVSK